MSFGTNTSITITLASLAYSSTLLTGRQSTQFDISSYKNVTIGGRITTGTSPTAGSPIEVWFVGLSPTGSYPDDFGASDASGLAVTREQLWTYGHLLANMIVSSDSSQAYSFNAALSQHCGGCNIYKYGILFVVNGTTVALNATAGNHSLYYFGET